MKKRKPTYCLVLCGEGRDRVDQYFTSLKKATRYATHVMSGSPHECEMRCLYRRSTQVSANIVPTSRTDAAMRN